MTAGKQSKLVEQKHENQNCSLSLKSPSQGILPDMTSNQTTYMQNYIIKPTFGLSFDIYT